ncbi:hypothetical protein QYE76_054094 [Lolium multiflorum]|uniref:CCHC-type domain-containing protein n=1 Tax=Lolium multiflorum TaxID=4521 RepID=A0AAD8WN72_LOLMU|nr:hypothetical protein QYE76_054094 [Lolium multiflorum]
MLQLLQTMLADRETERAERQANLIALQNIANQGHGNHDHPGSKLKNFQNTNPPVFSKTEEPLDADDWLQTMENNLEQAGEIDNLTVSLGQSTLVVLCRFHVGAGITGVAPHYIPPPSTFNVLLGSSCELPETAKTAETACDKAAEIFSNIGDDDPIALDYNGLNFDDCHISEVIKFLQKLAKSPNASAINLAFTHHITNALIKAREEKLEREASIPKKLEDGWEPIIKMKVKDFDCNALCDLGASISVMPKKIYNMLDLPPLKNCYLDVNLADHSTKKPLGSTLAPESPVLRRTIPPPSTFNVLLGSSWFDKPWFLSEGKLAAVRIIPSSWGLPNERVKYTQSEANEKVLFATHYLAGPARAWWTSTRAMNGGQFMTWEDFKLKFSKYHVPPGLIKKMRDEFRELKQGRMMVVEYRDKFLTLSRYAPDETDTNEKRKERFLNGLHDEMQTVLVNIPFADLEALVDSAIQMEGKLNQANENRKRRMANQSGSSHPQKFRPSSSGGGYNNNYNNNNYNRAPPRAPNNNNTNTNTAPRTGSNAVPVANKQDKTTITCYECGVVGHYSNECPKRLAKLAGNTAAPAQQQRRVSTGKKFAPNNPNNRNGRLYHMNAEEAQEAPDVVLDDLPGMPPDRDIEFIIELIPGTGPIAQRAYIMNPAELVELKKQIDDMLAKALLRHHVFFLLCSIGSSSQSSTSREPTPEYNPAEVHAANTRRAIAAGEESDHDFSIWSEDDQSSTDGESDLRFLAVGETEEESDDTSPATSPLPGEEEQEEEEEDDDESSSDEPPAKRFCPWPGNLSDSTATRTTLTKKMKTTRARSAAIGATTSPPGAAPIVATTATTRAVMAHR